MVPVILLLIIGVKTLIFSAPVEKIFSLEEFAGKKGRCNIASHEEGGHIVSFSSQKDFNDNAVFNLIDGDISQKGWQSEEGSPFPHEIVIALPGASPQKINQIIIFTGGNQSTPSVPKDIEFYISSSNKLDNFISVGTMTCRQTSLPQVYNFKKEMSVKFVKVKILSNWGNSKITSMKEIEISGPQTQSMEINPLKGNLMGENSGTRAICCFKKGMPSEIIPYRIKSSDRGPYIAFQFTSDELPGEVTFNLPESKTYIIDNLRLHFYPNESKPLANATQPKELEILVSTDSPIDNFISVGRFLCSPGKTIEKFPFLPQKAKYIKIKFISPMNQGGTIVVKDAELYQPIIARADGEDKNVQTQSGLLGKYFSGKNYRDFFRDRVDYSIDFNWGIKSPITGMGSSDYCIYWKGKLNIPENGYYEFGIKAVSGFQLYLDNQLIMEQWNEDNTQQNTQWITSKFRLIKGWYPIRLNYYHTKSDVALLTLSWKRPGDPDLQIIDRKYLSCMKVTDTKTIRTPRDAVQMGLDWSGEYLLDWQEKNKCYSCHAQPQVIRAFAFGNKNGYKYNIKASISTLDLLKSGINKDGSLKFPQSESLTALQFAGIALADYNTYIGDDNDDFLKVSNLLVARQMPQGCWKNDNVEPPLQQGDIMCTTNALLTLLHTYKKTKDEFFSPSIQKASAWLENIVPFTTQDIAFQIIGLSSYPSPDSTKVIQNNINKLYNIQNEDGGWGEMEGYKSSSFSTGQVIYALKLAGVKMSNPNFSKGVNYLIQNQNVFGSWPAENTQSKRPSEITSTVWAIIGLSNAFESLMITIINPTHDQTITPKDPNESYIIEATVNNSASTKISNVEFFLDANSIGIVDTLPYSIHWYPKNIPGGKHNIMAIVRDTQGKEASDTKTIFLDKSLKIKFLNPLSNSSITQPQINVQIELENKTNSPVAKIEYFLDNKLITSTNTEPFDHTLNTLGISNGKHILKATVHTEAGDSASTEQDIMINRKLSVVLEKPLSGTTIEDKIVFSSSIKNDSGSSITRVEYYLDDKLLGYSKEGPSYSYTYQVKTIPDGDYLAKAVIYNELGETSSVSNKISITRSLKISLRNIKDGASVTGIKEISAVVENKSKSPVSEVVYYLDKSIIGKAQKAPYNIKWVTTNQPSGNYTLKVIAYTEGGGKSHNEIKIKIEHPIAISLYSTVLDNSSTYTIQLKKEDFQIEEDNINQQLKDVRLCNEKFPTSYCIMVDTGQQMSTYLKDTSSAIQKFTNSISPGSDYSIILFSDKVIKKDKSSKIFSNIISKGGTAIYDTALECLSMFQGSTKRKVIIIFTASPDENQDGSAPGSKHKLEEVLREANNINCLIYVIAIGPRADQFLLSDLPDNTGGRLYAASGPNDIGILIEPLNFDLKYMYEIKYTSSNPVRDGKWRNIKVSIKEHEKYVVNCQKGYYAPKY